MHNGLCCRTAHKWWMNLGGHERNARQQRQQVKAVIVSGSAYTEGRMGENLHDGIVYQKRVWDHQNNAKASAYSHVEIVVHQEKLGLICSV